MFQSKKKESFECILTNMCMVYDNGNILVQDRLNKNWPGVAFPAVMWKTANHLLNPLSGRFMRKPG